MLNFGLTTAAPCDESKLVKLRYLCGFGLLLVSLALAQDKAKPEATYKALVEKVKAGDATVDFKQLRLAYSDIPHEKDPEPEKKAMFAALRSGNYEEAAKNAELVLASDYVDMDAHVAAAIANEALKNADKAAFHKNVYQQLMMSILDFGDGKSPKTAWMVIEVHEEYVALKALGINSLPTSQSLMQADGHSYDLLVVEDPDSKEERKLYFNVDIPIKHGE